MGSFDKKGQTPVDSLMVIDATGTPEQLGGHMTTNTIAFVAAVGAVKANLTDSASGFLNKMFKVGMFIQITGSTSNNIKCKIFSVTAGKIELTTDYDLTDEIAGDTVTLSCLDDIFCEWVLIQPIFGNTGAKAAIGFSNSIDVANDLGAVIAKGNSVNYENVYLGDLWVEADTNGDKLFIQYKEHRKIT